MVDIHDNPDETPDESNAVNKEIKSSAPLASTPEQAPSPDTTIVDDILPHHSREFLDEISEALDWDEEERVRGLIQDLHAADIADLIQTLSNANRERLIAIICKKLDPEILTYLNELTLPEVIYQIGIPALARALLEIDSDDASSIIEAMEPDQQRQVLKEIPAQDRENFEQVLSYPEDSAGRLMQQEVVVVPPFWTAKQTVNFLRTAADIPETFYNIYIVDARYHLRGSVPLVRLMRAQDNDKLSTLLAEDVKPIPVAMDQKEVAYLFQHYSLVSAPVVDEAGRLLGIITADDMAHVVEEETERDVLMLAGIGDTDHHMPLLETFYRRIGWLSVTLIDALLTTTVVSQFTKSIEQMVALAVLMPVVAAMAGNAGMQAVAVTVRALSGHDLHGPKRQRTILKEVMVGSLNGLFFSSILIIVAVSYYKDLGLAAILSAAMMFNMLWAALAGTILPLMIDKFGFDPAVASGPILVATTDILGYASFLGLATYFLL